MCLKELNEKCRISSFSLLNAIADKLLSNEDEFKDYLNMLIEGINMSSNEFKNTDTYCSASLLALSSLTYNYNGKSIFSPIFNFVNLHDN